MLLGIGTIGMITGSISTYFIKRHDSNDLDDLYKYKKMLDDGIITDEDYKKIKNKLLDL